jgi:vacuolar-type H+-ATPase subunit E/Vma4
MKSLLGLPDIGDPQRASAMARAAMERHRAARSAAENQARAVSLKEIEKCLQTYCQAATDLRTGVRERIELYRLDEDRKAMFTQANLPALDQLIEWTAVAAGLRKATPTANPRIWA